MLQNKPEYIGLRVGVQPVAAMDSHTHWTMQRPRAQQMNR
uniref:Uncharacterized protein n=1 Tax=Anguilla anguilla TaxID=7936 RepID=A0A0E9S918_ANGAN